MGRRSTPFCRSACGSIIARVLERWCYSPPLHLPIPEIGKATVPPVCYVLPKRLEGGGLTQINKQKLISLKNSRQVLTTGTTTTTPPPPPPAPPTTSYHWSPFHPSEGHRRRPLRTQLPPYRGSNRPQELSLISKRVLTSSHKIWRKTRKRRRRHQLGGKRGTPTSTWETPSRSQLDSCSCSHHRRRDGPTLVRLTVHWRG